MEEHRSRSGLLSYADRVADLTSAWSDEKKDFARRSTSAVISPIPQSIDVGPHKPRPSDFLDLIEHENEGKI